MGKRVARMKARPLMGMVVMVVPHRKIFQDSIMTALDLDGLPARGVDLFCRGTLVTGPPAQAGRMEP